MPKSSITTIAHDASIGNAIMSKYPLKEAHVIDHKYQPVGKCCSRCSDRVKPHTVIDWDREGHELREPRRGRRCSIAAVIETPLNEPLLCYSVHLEVFTGILGRLAQFSEVDTLLCALHLSESVNAR